MSFKRSWLGWMAILLLLTSCNGFGAESGGKEPLAHPKAEQGMIDGETWDFDKQGILPLYGEWSFYWNSLLEPKDFIANTPEPTGYMDEPRSWNNYVTKDGPLPGYGYATYRLEIRKKPNGETWGLYIPTMSTAYRLWVNGREVANNGVVGTSAETMRPMFLPETAYFEPKGEITEIVVQVSNFVHRRGGLWKGMFLGADRQISDMVRTKLAYELFMIGSLIMIGFYHLAFFALRRKDRSNLYFGLLCLVISLHGMNVGEHVLILWFPNFSWEWALKMEYWGTAAGTPLIILLFHRLFPQEASRTFERIWVFIGSVYSLFILLAPGSFYSRTYIVTMAITLTAFVYLIGLIILAVRRKREAAKFVAATSLLFFAAATSDLLYYNELHRHWPDLSKVGLFVFIFSQSFILAKKATRAFHSQETLSKQLAKSNTQLDEKVRERTEILEQTNNRLEQAHRELYHLDQSRRRLISNITHDLKTPLASVRAYLEAVLDGVVDSKEETEEYIRTAHARAIGLDRLLQDLFELSDLDTRGIRFQNEPISVERLLAGIRDKYGKDAVAQGIDFTLNIDPAAATCVLHVDVHRMDQVFSNLISNAIRYTPHGGTIRIEARNERNATEFRISDSGCGIAEEHVPFVFERFYTCDSSRSGNEQHHGLGLSIVKEIIEYYGGSVRVESEVRVGTTVAFSLRYVDGSFKASNSPHLELR